MKKLEPEDEDSEDFEEFDEDDSDGEDDEEYKPVKKPVAKKEEYVQIPMPKKKPVSETPRATPEELKQWTSRPVQPQPIQQPVQPQIQYVAVLKAVSIETMVNELYDVQQEMRQILSAILERLK